MMDFSQTVKKMITHLPSDAEYNSSNLELKDDTHVIRLLQRFHFSCIKFVDEESHL